MAGRLPTGTPVETPENAGIRSPPAAPGRPGKRLPVHALVVLSLTLLTSSTGSACSYAFVLAILGCAIDRARRSPGVRLPATLRLARIRPGSLRTCHVDH